MAAVGRIYAGLVISLACIYCLGETMASLTCELFLTVLE